MSIISDVARALFDGGWRCTDLKYLMSYYDYSYEEAYEICLELELLEREDNND